MRAIQDLKADDVFPRAFFFFDLEQLQSLSDIPASKFEIPAGWLGGFGLVDIAGNLMITRSVGLIEFAGRP
jgi:hypothetical protein